MKRDFFLLLLPLSIFLVFAGALGFSVGFNILLIPDFLPKANAPVFMGVSMVLIVVGAILIKKAYRPIQKLSEPKPVTKQLPIVYSYIDEKNIMRVIPEVDWKLWHEERERKELAGLPHTNVKPDSRILIQFSDDTGYTKQFSTGTMDQYRELIKNCRQETKVMQIHYGWPALDLKTAYKMVYGPDAKPPADP